MSGIFSEWKWHIITWSAICRAGCGKEAEVSQMLSKSLPDAQKREYSTTPFPACLFLPTLPPFALIFESINNTQRETGENCGRFPRKIQRFVAEIPCILLKYINHILVCIRMLHVYLYVFLCYSVCTSMSGLACIRIICTLMHPCVTHMLPVVLAWCFTHGRPRALDTCWYFDIYRKLLTHSHGNSLFRYQSRVNVVNVNEFQDKMVSS